MNATNGLRAEEGAGFLLFKFVGDIRVEQVPSGLEARNKVRLDSSSCCLRRTR
jgi:hypothetical protein